MIKEFREQHNLTQAEFGKLVGLSQPAISVYEKIEKEMVGRWKDMTEGHILCHDYIVFVEGHKRVCSVYKNTQKTCEKQPELDLQAPTLPEKKDRSILSILFGWLKRWLGL